MFHKKRRWHCLPGQEPTELDKQVMYWEAKGKEVPTRALIKTPEQIEGIRKSGLVNTGCLDEVARQIHVGMTTQEIDDTARSTMPHPPVWVMKAIPRVCAPLLTRWCATAFPKRPMCCRRAISSTWI